MPREKKSTAPEGTEEETLTETPKRRKTTRTRKPRVTAKSKASKETEETKIPEILPLVPIRDSVYFPHMVVPLVVGREKSVRALEQARAQDRIILLVAQKDIGVDDPGPEDLYQMGTAAEIMQTLNFPDGTMRVVLEAIGRVQITEYLQADPFYCVRVEQVVSPEEKGLEVDALMRNVVADFQQMVEMGRTIPPEALINVMNIDEPGRMADAIVPYLQLKVNVKQELLEIIPTKARLEKLSVYIKRELEIMEIQRDIRSRVEKEMSDTQKEYVLREQLKAIQQELGERDEHGSEIAELKKKIEEAKMPDEVRERSNKEVDRLERMPAAAPEGVVIRTYLDWLISLPWSNVSEDRLNIEEAAQILDKDHYGLKKVKERVLEFLAVRQLSGSMKGPILCFVGPPGVGKTSIGKSIARSLGRKFYRLSLGGIRDEAEIRGHRRTYIGALPGRIIQGIKQVGTKNPVFMLDEIDKVGMDFRGDPTAALLEALDPEQNGTFSDHYLEVPFDLSDVMFITTANLLDPIPPALKDRMEVIPFPGYIEDEKLQIAKGFLVPKQVKENGLNDETISFGDDSLQKIIREYTREAGVRNLEREVAGVCRKIARKVAQGDKKLHKIVPEEIEEYLGPTKFHWGIAEKEDEVGAATGLAWTEFGGDVLTVECTLLKSPKGTLLLTGQLGDVMKESAQAALSYIRSRARSLDIDEDFYERTEVHIHVPEGAIPKDGPSAGITMATSMASALTKRPIDRYVAMTGEITLRGKVLPIGGLKEKVLAAHRAGIRTVIFPKENEKDLEEIPENVRTLLQFKPVSHMDEVLEIALKEPVLSK